MKRLTFALIAVSAISVLTVDAGRAAADGFSIQVGGPAYGYYGAQPIQRYNTYYGSRFGNRFGSYGSYYPQRDHSWHDTSHFDYHPGGFVRHYDHYDYVPGHFDFHEEGHWDHHHW